MPVFDICDDQPLDVSPEAKASAIAAFYEAMEEACNHWVRNTLPLLLDMSRTHREIRRLKRRAKRFPLREPYWEGML